MQLRWTGIDHFLNDIGERYANATALSLRNNAVWQSIDYATLNANARIYARSLQQSGLQPGEGVAVLGASGIEGTLQYLAVLLAGGVLFPLDPKLSEAELLGLLRHAEPRFLIVPREFRQLGFELRAGVPAVEKLLYLEEPAPVLLDTVSRRFPTRELRDCAAVFYTSGTVGAAKGVMISYENLFSELTMLKNVNENFPSDVLFSILPLHHLYGLIAGVLYSLACGAEYCFAQSLAPQDIAACLRERKVTQMSAVPLLLALLRRGILKQVEGQKPFQRWVFNTLFTVAPLLPCRFRAYLFGPIHAGFGGHMRRIISGAAPLDPVTYDFFHRIGIPVYEGYGLTETGPVISMNTTKRVKRGTVGQPMDGVEVRLGEDGEILTRGPHVMLGYFKAPELTREVLTEEGWFHTGDIGRLEKDFLRITGRKKSLIVLDSGKKVHSEEVEQALQLSANFQDVCVIGLPLAGQGEQVVAVVYPAPHLLNELVNVVELEAKVSAEVQQLARKLAAFKRPARVIVRREPLPKTASGKIKRHVLRAEMEQPV